MLFDFSFCKFRQNSENDYIEYTLLLHCKLKTKKNARVFDFSGVLEFLDEFRMITFSFTSSLNIVLLGIFNLVHLHTSDFTQNRTANSNLGTSFIVDLD